MPLRYRATCRALTAYTVYPSRDQRLHPQVPAGIDCRHFGQMLAGRLVLWRNTGHPLRQQGDGPPQVVTGDRHADLVNQTVQTLILAGSTLLAVVITFAGSYLLQRWHAHQEADSRRQQAIAELMAAANDLANGLVTLRAAYARRTSWRYWLGLAATFWLDARKLTGWRDLTNAKKIAPLVRGALHVHREQMEDQRIAALDVTNVLQTRLNRYLSVAGVLALGDDKVIAEAVQTLTPKVTALVSRTAGRKQPADHAIKAAQEALGEFAAIADKRGR